MKEQEAINYLEQLEAGNFLTINIPLSNKENIPITAMYMGKDENGRYHFADSGKFIFTKEFIKQGKITIDKEFDEDKTFDIYCKIKLKKKNKEIER